MSICGRATRTSARRGRWRPQQRDHAARIGDDTARWNGFDLFGEYEGSSAFFDQDDDSTTNGRTMQVKYADDTADHFSVGTRKVWIEMDDRF